jgi:general secretion pathway protein H
MVTMQISTAGRSNNQAGFTLIELALVVLLLGLMASLSLPLLSGFEPNRLDSSARRLAGTVKYLYNEAAMTGMEHRLIFELANNAYRATKVSLSGELQPLQGVGAQKKLSSGVEFASIYQPRRGEQSDGEVTTALLPGGWMEETIIHLQDEKKQKMTLRLVPLTGLTEIYEGYRDFR